MRVLIIGLGSIARKHIDALLKINCETKIVALRSSKNSNNFGNIKSIYTLEKIDLTKFDFAIISNPTHRHFQTLIQLKESSLPLFIEKPLFHEIGDAQGGLVRYLTRSNHINYVACNLRFLNCLQEIKKIISKERINEVNSYSGSFLPDWRSGKDFRKIYSSNPQMGGGVHLDLIHELDYNFWIFGEPQKTSSLLKNTSHLDIEAIDYANYQLEYEEFSSNIIVNYYRRDTKRTLEIVCENGTYFIDLLKNKINFREEEIFNSNQNILDTYFDQMKFFIDNILTRKEKFNDVEEAYKILKICIKD